MEDFMIHKNWADLIKPTQLDVKPGNDPTRQATVTAEPLERGFGLTLGNALRRVLMSSFRVRRLSACRLIMFCTSFPALLAYAKMSPISF